MKKKQASTGRIAIWNAKRGIWENPTGSIDLLSEHSEPFLATWPTSGMTRNGQAFELPMPELHTEDSGYSLLPTAGVAGGGKQIPADAIWSGKAAYKPDGTKVQVHLDRIEMLLKPPTPLLPTPRAVEAGFSLTAPAAMRHAAIGMGSLTEVIGYSLMPTPRTSDTNGAGEHGTGGPDLRTVVSLLPTPAAMNPNDGERLATWQARYEFHANKSEKPTRAGMPLAIAVQMLPTGGSTDPRSDGGKP